MTVPPYLGTEKYINYIYLSGMQVKLIVWEILENSYYDHTYLYTKQ